MLLRVLRRAVWELPHDWRRLAFRMCYPHSHRSHRQRRAKAEGTYSLKPFDDHKCIFVHIPKCAGSSISTALFGNLSGGHMTARKSKLVFNRKEYNEYFKFAFVRNPWDRVLSAYLFLKQGGSGETDRKWAQQHLSAYPDFDTFVQEWLNRENVHRGWHFTPQHLYLLDRHGQLLVDFVGYFETLQEDYSIVREIIQTGSPLAHTNRTEDRPRDFRDSYSDATRQIVADVYREDISLLGYCFEAGPPLRRLQTEVTIDHFCVGSETTH